MMFMVIEHFDQARVKETYRRFDERGRMMQEWVLEWSDLARFEIVPLAPSKATSAAIRKHL